MKPNIAHLATPGEFDDHGARPRFLGVDPDLIACALADSAALGEVLALIVDAPDLFGADALPCHLLGHDLAAGRGLPWRKVTCQGIAKFDPPQALRPYSSDARKRHRKGRIEGRIIGRLVCRAGRVVISSDALGRANDAAIKARSLAKEKPRLGGATQGGAIRIGRAACPLRALGAGPRRDSAKRQGLRSVTVRSARPLASGLGRSLPGSWTPVWIAMPAGGPPFPRIRRRYESPEFPGRYRRASSPSC